MKPPNLTKLEQVMLDRLSHNYENINSIISNISEDMGTKVATADLFLILIKLHRKNLVSAYLYDPTIQAYSLTSAPENEKIENVWWLEKKNALKHDETGICTCPCHDNPHSITHPVECCGKCPRCKRGIARGMMNEHLKVCTGQKRK